MKVGRRYNWGPVRRDEAGTGFVLFAIMVAIVFVFCA
jgi:hypothetical protein